MRIIKKYYICYYNITYTFFNASRFFPIRKTVYFKYCYELFYDLISI